MPTISDQELMRDCVFIEFTTGQSGVKNTVFGLTIPEGYAMVIHDVDFGMGLGSAAAANNWSFYLIDDPDEEAAPGMCAEKVIQSTEFILQVAEGQGFLWQSKDCHKTMLVVNPNFIVSQSADALATVKLLCRIWFDFIKISPQKILELLRQQQY